MFTKTETRTERKKVEMTPTQFVIWVGEASGQTFKLMPQKGIITEPINITFQGIEYTVKELGDEIADVPQAGIDCLELVRLAKAPRKQFLIAHEVVPKREVEKPEIDIDFEKIFKTVGLIIAGIVTISLYVLSGLFSLLLLADPILIVVVDSPDEGDPWVDLYEYI